MMKKKGKDNKAHAAAEEEAAKHTGQSPTESLSGQTFEEYQCTGNVQVDFPRLCTLLDLKDIPAINIKTTETDEAEQSEENKPHTPTQWSKPCLHVDLENRSPLSTKGINIYGWKVDEQIFQVLKKILPHLSRLQSLHFWQAGLTDQMVMSLMNMMSLGCNLRVVYLEGNPLPNQSYHLLLSEDSVITHLFLRNNRIGDEGARLIGAALSTTRTANKNLLFLNLAFNSIGDAGAIYLSQGLRLNRALLYLSLANNQIGDSGAAHLSKILGEFPLTHEEVVERRKLLAEKMDLNFGLDLEQHEEGQVLLSGGNSPVKADPKGNAKKKEVAKKDEKAEKVPANKENLKKGAQKRPKTPEAKVSPAKGGKAGGKKKSAQADAQEDRSATALTEPEVEVVNPLLDSSVQCRDGQIFLPGNTTLVYLSLAGNRITEKSLPLFLSSVEQQTEEGGLLRLCLQRNHFSPDCELYNKINHLVQLRDPLNKPDTEETKEEENKT